MAKGASEYGVTCAKPRDSLSKQNGTCCHAIGFLCMSKFKLEAGKRLEERVIAMKGLDMYFTYKGQDILTNPGLPQTDLKMFGAKLRRLLDLCVLYSLFR